MVVVTGTEGVRFQLREVIAGWFLKIPICSFKWPGSQGTLVSKYKRKYVPLYPVDVNCFSSKQEGTNTTEVQSLAVNCLLATISSPGNGELRGTGSVCRSGAAM